MSGRCPEGGIDIIAEEVADDLGIPKIIHAPKVNQWNPQGRYGYKARNLDISKDSDVLHDIVVKEYPPGYTGRRFESCYHCAGAGRPSTTHCKSGGCYTLNRALEWCRQCKAPAIHVSIGENYRCQACGTEGKKGEIHIVE